MKSPKSKTVRIAAQELRVHPLAQRQLVPSKLKQLAANLDLDAIGVLHAVEYEIGGVRAVWIVDGQHRLRSLMENGCGEWLVEVKVHVEATDNARASELFLKLNNRSPVSPFDKFDNEVKAGFASAAGAVELLQNCGLKVARSTGDTSVCCVSTLKTLFAYDDGATLALTLNAVITAWGRTAAALEGKIIEGVGLIFGMYGGSVDQPALVKKLAKYPGGAAGLIGDAKGMRQFRKASLARCVAERIIETYNVGRRSGKLDLL